MLDLEKQGWDLKTVGHLDHHIVKAPYIQMTSYTEGKKGDYVFTYDLRFTQPNTEYMTPRVMHSLEHLLLVGFRKYIDGYIGLGPMGCQTGFYLTLINEYDAKKIATVFEKILNDILVATEVPLANATDCGQGDYHDLEGAKIMAKKVLDKKDTWYDIC